MIYLFKKFDLYSHFQLNLVSKWLWLETRLDKYY